MIERVRTLACLALAVVLLAACGGPEPEELLEGAVAALEAAGTSQFEMQVTAAGAPDQATYRASGAQDLADGSLRMTIDLGDDQTTTETLFLGADVYLRSPLFELLTGDRDTWVRLDLEAAGAEAGLDTDALLASNTGPAALVAQLDGATEDVDELGREDVRGVATRRLRLTVSTDAALAQAPAEVRDQLRAYAEATGLPSTYPMEVWIDGDGLVRRIRTVIDSTEDPDATTGLTQETTLELFDFGVSVDLDPPREEQVIDLEDLIRQLDEAEAELLG